MDNNRYELNKELAKMLKGGVIMDVTTPEQAKIAEASGACAVMALERIPADIRAAGGVSRMSDPKMIRGIQEAVSIPVMAKCRIGHFVEAQILEAIEIDYIDEIRKLKSNRYLIGFQNETGDNFGLFISKIKSKQSNGGVATIAIEYTNNYDIVEKTINKKEKKLLDYKVNYNQNYLLLVVDPFVVKGSIFNFDDKFYKHKFKTNL